MEGRGLVGGGYLLVYLVPASAFSQVTTLTCLVHQREAVEGPHHPSITCVHHTLRIVTFTYTPASLLMTPLLLLHTMT